MMKINTYHIKGRRLVLGFSGLILSFRNLRENLTEEEEGATAEGDVTAFMNKAIEGQEKCFQRVNSRLTCRFF